MRCYQTVFLLSALQAARNLEPRVITVDKNAAYHKAFDVLNPSQAEVAIASEGIAQEKATGKATLATLDKERKALISSGFRSASS